MPQLVYMASQSEICSSCKSEKHLILEGAPPRLRVSGPNILKTTVIALVSYAVIQVHTALSRI